MVPWRPASKLTTAQGHLVKKLTLDEFFSCSLKGDLDPVGLGGAKTKSTTCLQLSEGPPGLAIQQLHLAVLVGKTQRHSNGPKGVYLCATRGFKLKWHVYWTFSNRKICFIFVHYSHILAQQHTKCSICSSIIIILSLIYLLSFLCTRLNPLRHASLILVPLNKNFSIFNSAISRSASSLFCQCHRLQTTDHNRSCYHVVNLPFHSYYHPSSKSTPLCLHSLVHCLLLWMVDPKYFNSSTFKYLCSLHRYCYTNFPLIHTCILSCSN